MSYLSVTRWRPYPTSPDLCWEVSGVFTSRCMVLISANPQSVIGRETDFDCSPSPSPQESGLDC